MSETFELFFEVGAEEIPAREVTVAIDALRSSVVSQLAELRLPHGPVASFSTPRRLTLVVPGLVSRQSDLEREVAGPPAQAAFKDGQPTKAAEGFAKTSGVEVSALFVKDTPKGPYVHARVHEKGQETRALLPEVLRRALLGIPFSRTMRWGDQTEAFIRPLQWMVALYGGEVLPVRYADITAGRESRGHRFMAPTPFAVESAAQYLDELERRFVVVDPEVRKARILERAETLAGSVGGRLRADAALIEEVVQLVENPIAWVTHFDPKYLEIPDQVLISEMRNHQRYLSVVDAEGRLLPHFVVIGNSEVEDPRRVLDGYRRVLSARFSDGAFFFQEDQKRPLFSRVDDLRKVQYHRALGSSYAKVERVAHLAFWLARALGLEVGPERGSEGLRRLAEEPDAGERDSFAHRLARTAFLAKADLTTRMVFEFPELQGVMGAAYAKRGGEPVDVAVGVEEHYLPRNASDRLPAGVLGAVVGLADRLDTICGIFSVGKGPSGAADPFGLRRAAIGIINVLRDRGWHVSLGAAVRAGVAGIGAARKREAEEVEREVLEFLRGRLRGVLTGEAGLETDLSEAVLVADSDDVVDAELRGRALAELRGRPEYEPVKTSFKRVSNILRNQEAGAFDAARLTEPAEQALMAALGSVEAAARKARDARDFAAAFSHIASLRPAVDRFFDEVMVMAEDAGLRSARLGLLRRVEALFAPLADFAKLS